MTIACACPNIGQGCAKCKQPDPLRLLRACSEPEERSFWRLTFAISFGETFMAILILQCLDLPNGTFPSNLFKGVFTVYEGVSTLPHTPGPIFHARYIHSWSSAGTKEVDVGSLTPRAFRRRAALY